MNSDARREYIHNILKQTGNVTVNDLVDKLQVSPATVRRDLEQMEQENLLRRTYGGAIDVHIGFEPSYASRLEDCAEEKAAIGKATAPLVHAGQIVAIDAGTTTAYVSRNLTNTSPLTIITPSLTIAQIFAEAPGDDFTVVMPGGVLRSKTLSLVGPVAEQTLLNYRADVTIMGCQALDASQGAMSTNLLATSEKRALVKIGSKIIIVADHTKFERTALAVNTPIKDIDMIVTDWKTPEHIINPFREQGIEVVVATPDSIRRDEI